MAYRSPDNPDRPVYVAVIGPGDPKNSDQPGDIVPGDMDAAKEVGRLLAAHGAILLCGGLGGVMKAACMGAHNHKPTGITVGFLPGDKHGDGNDHLSIEIPTGLGELRNALVVGAAEAVIVVGGSWGTLNEVSLAMKLEKPIFQIGGWRVTPTSTSPTPRLVADASEAVEAALTAIQEHRNACRPEA